MDISDGVCSPTVVLQPATGTAGDAIEAESRVGAHLRSAWQAAGEEVLASQQFSGGEGANDAG